MQTIYEHPSGVMLQVQFQPATATEGAVIHDVRLLGADYKPTGPDLTYLLHDMHTVEQGVATGDLEVSRFLQTVLTETAPCLTQT